MSSIRIINTPQGHAPLWVRKEWVGVTISLATPLYDEIYKYPGYEVTIISALRELERKSPRAAYWFTVNLPTFNGNFKFRKEECEYLP